MATREPVGACLAAAASGEETGRDSQARVGGHTEGQAKEVRIGGRRKEDKRRSERPDRRQGRILATRCLWLEPSVDRRKRVRERGVCPNECHPFSEDPSFLIRSCLASKFASLLPPPVSARPGARARGERREARGAGPRVAEDASGLHNPGSNLRFMLSFQPQGRIFRSRQGSGEGEGRRKKHCGPSVVILVWPSCGR